MHRQRMIASDTFTLLFALGLLLAVLAVAVSIASLARLWQSGFRGWGRTFQALILGLVLASPLGIAVSWGLTYPATNDVATTGALPGLVLAHNPEERRLPAAATAAAFPNAVARTYTLPPDKIFALVSGLAADRQWDVRISRKPVTPGYPGRLNALAMTLLGYRDEVAILVDRSADGSVVSMRSASLFGIRDLGVNGLRIEAFLTDLDQAVTEAQRDGPIIDGLTPGASTPDANGTGQDGSGG